MKRWLNVVVLVTSTVGAAAPPDPAEVADSLRQRGAEPDMRAAERALYRAARQGTSIESVVAAPLLAGDRDGASRAAFTALAVDPAWCGRAVATLIGAASSPDAAVRDAAAEVLRLCRGASPRAIPVLRTLLADPSRSVRLAAANALHYMDTPPAAARPELKKLLADVDDGVASVAASTLARLGAKGAGALAALERLASRGGRLSAASAQRAANAIRYAKSARPTSIAADLLVDVKASKEDAERFQSAALAAGADGTVRRAVIEMIIASPGVDRRRVARALRRIGVRDARAEAALVEQLHHPDDDVRALAAAMLGEMSSGEPRTLEALGAAMKDPAHDVALAAAAGLARSGAVAVPLLAAAVAAGDPATAVAAAYGLQIMTHPAAEDAASQLGARLTDPEVSVRCACAIALAMHDIVTNVLAPLGECLQIDNATLRFLGARALGRTGPSAVPLLRAALLDPDAMVRNDAVWSLRRIGTPEALELLPAGGLINGTGTFVVPQ